MDVEQEKNKKKYRELYPNGGRPPTYLTAEDMQKKINEYFNEGMDTRIEYIKLGYELKEVEIPTPTITGLTLFLGFADRKSFYEYEEKPEFTHTMRRARLFIECEYEKQLLINPSGAIFALKNFGWLDKQTLEHEGEIKTNDKEIKDIASSLNTLLDGTNTTS